MSRETYIESQIAANSPSAQPQYLDAAQIARGLGQHLTECFIGQVLGAGGVGGTLTGIPFNPAVIEIINEAGSAPAFTKYVMLATPIGVQIILAAADATSEAPAVSAVAGPPRTWSALLDTADAPDGETVTVICYGARDVNGSL
ncbi:MAG TPA: hypothetical protein VFH61_06235 [Thermoleophilia bacterium]|nr:hypothetical protein [Thermoleophilia bacterium]